MWLPQLTNIATGLFLVFLTLAFAVSAAESPYRQVYEGASCQTPRSFSIINHNIFDLSEDGIGFVHRIANTLNKTTRASTIKNEMAFVDDKCELSDADLHEIERHLRSLKYLQDAKVEKDENGDIEVQTWDTWTLLPTFDYGREGGKNDYSIGLKDRNLMGYGVYAEVESFSNAQRSGFRFFSEFPLYQNENMLAALKFVDTDDGEIKAVRLQRPFVSFDTRHSFLAFAEQAEVSETFFLNGGDLYQLAIDQEVYRLSWGRLVNNNAKRVKRIKVGIDAIDKHFVLENGQAQPREDIRDRNVFVPYVELEFQQKKFRELSNVYLINQIEDFNIGTHFYTKIGVNLKESNNEEPLVFTSAKVTKGLYLTDTFLLMNNVDIAANAVNSAFPRWKISATSELFERSQGQFGFYAKQSLTMSHNAYFDDIISIGGVSGVRGYPLDFQRGKHKVALSAEMRWYPNVNIGKLFELGGVAFVDAGRTFDTADFPNDIEGWLGAVGVGARLYSQKSAEAHVIHFDIAFPTRQHENVSSVEFRITTSHAF